MGDFSTSNDYKVAQSCDQNLFLIQIFGAVLALAALIAFPLKFLFSYKRHTNEMANKTVQSIQTNYGILSGFYDLTHFIHGLLKAIAPQTYVVGVGMSPGMDVLFFIMTVIFFSLMNAETLNLCYFSFETAKIMPQERQDKVEKVVESCKGAAIFYLYSIVIYAFFPFFTYANSSAQLPMALIFLITYWSVMGVHSLANCWLLGTVGNELDSFPSDRRRYFMDSLSQEDALSIQKAANRLSTRGAFHGFRFVIQSYLWIFFALFPSLRRKFTYYYMCHYFLYYFPGLLTLKALWNFVPAKEGVGGGNATSKAPPSLTVPSSNPSRNRLPSSESLSK